MKKESKKIAKAIDIESSANTEDVVIKDNVIVDTPEDVADLPVSEFRDAGVPANSAFESSTLVADDADIPDVATIIGVPVEVVTKVIETTVFVPQIGVKYLFTNENNEFIGEIKSFDPLVVWEWSVLNGVQHNAELSIDSLNEYTITDIGKDEIFRRLA